MRSSRRATVEPGGPAAGLDAVLDALPVGAYLVDSELRVVAWNARREAGPHGRPRSEVLGRRLEDVLPSSGFRAVEPILRQVLTRGEPHEETREADGHARQYRVLRLPVRQGRRVTHVLSWFEDVTERRALEMQLIAADRLAFLGQLVAGVAHEVANPLASIAGCAEALGTIAREVQRPEARREADEFLSLLRGEVARCERILRGLLSSARPSRATTSDLGATVNEVLKLLERHPAFTRVRTRLRFPPGLPLAAIDADSLKQVIVALATNAARAMSGGGTLVLGATQADGELRLDVRDTGPGVPPGLRRRIFEPFFTTDTTRGSGLGLAIARSLVRGHGGDLVLLPGRRGGARFRVRVPAVRGDEGRG